MDLHFLQSSRLGNLLLRRQLITEAQLNEAIRYHKSHPELPLGETLVLKRFITPKQLKRTLRWQSSIRCATVAMAFTMLPLHAVSAATQKTVPNNTKTPNKWTSYNQLVAPNRTVKPEQTADDGAWHINQTNSSITYPKFQFRNSSPYQTNRFENIVNFIAEDKSPTQQPYKIDYFIDVIKVNSAAGPVLNIKWNY